MVKKISRDFAPVSARVAADAHPLPTLGFGKPAGDPGATGRSSAGAAALVRLMLGDRKEIRLIAETPYDGETYIPVDPSRPSRSLAAMQDLSLSRLDRLDGVGNGR